MNPPSVLARIVERARERVAEARRGRPPAAMAAAAEAAPPTRNFVAALRRPGELNVIAEFKPASPSEGPLRPASEVGEIVAAYQRAGAVAASILTEPDFFGSGLQVLRQARESCSLPLLRKDFIIDPYQIDEARAHGADAVLLIVAALDDALLAELIAASAARDLAALVEVHDGREIDRALAAGADVVGINQRDLTDLSVDPGLAARLLRTVPRGATIVAESGLSKAIQLRRLRQRGCHAFLIGTHLMRAPDPGRALEEMLCRGSGSSSAG